MNERQDTMSTRRLGVIVAALIVLAFVAIAIAKQGPTPAVDTFATSSASEHETADDGPSSSRADAMVAYDAALQTGKPVYVLFHSLTCVPCIEISAVVDKVVPDYEGSVVFVNAISDDAPSQRLAAKFRFQYIPTSFFIDARGVVVDSFTGAMDESAMREYLDKLVAE